MVGVEVQMHKSTFFYEIGTGEFLGSFFDSVTCLLEDRQRGKKFPTLRLLYLGELIKKDNLGDLANELATIKERFKGYSTNDVVWDMEDATKKPPWGADISEGITDLSNYFVTCNGKQLFDVLSKAINHAQDLDTYLHIKSTFENPIALNF